MAQTVGTVDPSSRCVSVCMCEDRPANPVRLCAVLKHSSGTAAGVSADFQQAQTDGSLGNFNGVLIV